VTIASLAGTRPQHAGVASGLVNTTRQIGGAVGLAAMATLVSSVAGSSPSAAATVHGDHVAFGVLAVLALAPRRSSPSCGRTASLQPSTHRPSLRPRGGSMMTSPIDHNLDDLRLQARGLELVRGILAARGASAEELDAHTRELERVRAQLARKLVA
jgi:hypothetical protein